MGSSLDVRLLTPVNDDRRSSFYSSAMRHCVGCALQLHGLINGVTFDGYSPSILLKLLMLSHYHAPLLAIILIYTFANGDTRLAEHCCEVSEPKHNASARLIIGLQEGGCFRCPGPARLASHASLFPA